MRRVVLDTNVLVAAAYNARAASRRIVEACLAGQLEMLCSEALRREYDFILRRAIRGRDYAERLESLIDSATLVEVEHTPRVVPEDPDDDKLIALALAGRADALITSDQHLLTLNPYQGIPIATAGAIARQWGI